MAATVLASDSDGSPPCSPSTAIPRQDGAQRFPNFPPTGPRARCVNPIDTDPEPRQPLIIPHENNAPSATINASLPIVLSALLDTRSYASWVPVPLNLTKNADESLIAPTVTVKVTPPKYLPGLPRFLDDFIDAETRALSTTLRNGALLTMDAMGRRGPIASTLSRIWLRCKYSLAIGDFGGLWKSFHAGEWEVCSISRITMEGQVGIRMTWKNPQSSPNYGFFRSQKMMHHLVLLPKEKSLDDVRANDDGSSADIGALDYWC